MSIHNSYKFHESGFSLVELSIVLVILGLLVGGILSGQSLIQAAELRAVTSEFQRYATATQAFRDKYFFIPGDMNNATSFWGKSATYCNGDTGTATAAGTCNGNGDGLFTIGSGGGNSSSEYLQFWHQLELAGLIEGTYTGASSAGGWISSTAGVNVPKSKLNNGAWAIENPTWSEMGDSITFFTKMGNSFMFGAIVSGASPYGPLLTPQNAWNIDMKLDDGKPGYGKIVALYWNNLCSAADDGSSANNDLAASYRVSDNTARCALKFRGYI